MLVGLGELHSLCQLVPLAEEAWHFADSESQLALVAAPDWAASLALDLVEVPAAIAVRSAFYQQPLGLESAPPVAVELRSLRLPFDPDVNLAGSSLRSASCHSSGTSLDLSGR